MTFVRAVVVAGSATMFSCALSAAALSATAVPTQDDSGDALWQTAARLESQGELLQAARAFENVARSRPGDPRAYWRASKCYWRYGDALPAGRADDARGFFQLTEHWADAGLAADPGCGECYLYKVAGMGGRLREGGKLAAARQADDIARLLERGISIMSARPGAATDPELEETYYAAAQLYRSIPEWRWLGWVLGVRGSRRRAVDYMRKANDISRALGGERAPYVVELGAALLCLAADEKDATLRAEGEERLRGVTQRAPSDAADPVSARHAAVLLEHPEKACDYSRADWEKG